MVLNVNYIPENIYNSMCQCFENEINRIKSVPFIEYTKITYNTDNDTIKDDIKIVSDDYLKIKMDDFFDL